MFSQFVVAADNLLEAGTSAHDLDHQPAGTRMSLMLVKDVTLFHGHVHIPGVNEKSTPS
jgi:hypothetical protein